MTSAAWRWHRPLMVFSGLMVVTALVSAIGLLVDGRMLSGEPIWLKPFKFSVSLVLYSVTWAWLLSLQHRPRRWMGRLATISAVLLGVEMVIIIGQVLRGRASHFNAETNLDGALFTIMGVAIATVWVLGMIQGVVLLRERLAERSLAWAIRFGIVLGAVGIGLSFLMLGATGDQADAIAQGIEPDRVGAHTVGLPDGGPGMPITGWSTVGGDLRIPHFVGIHALQALPLFALLIRRFVRPAARTRLVFVAAGSYTGLIALVTWQALRGQSLIHPDAWTLIALGALVAATALGTLVALRESAATPDLGLAR